MEKGAEMNLVKEINMLTTIIAGDASEKYRIEEELLFMLTRVEKHPVSVKKQALARIEKINKEQLRLLGAIIAD